MLVVALENHEETKLELDLELVKAKRLEMTMVMLKGSVKENTMAWKSDSWGQAHHIAQARFLIDLSQLTQYSWILK